ncbi:unnamed protein product [Peronospora farinosa]|uniref:DDE-1 domain-containing protein n=1 Tax=Peronospora farinosa TaxID=134698 RepID=A0ABN8CE66_9STRA|nr:unnamed protein product [Peronospora farinosa]
MKTVDVVICPVGNHNVHRLQELNLQLLAVRYNLAFYKEVFWVLHWGTLNWCASETTQPELFAVVENEWK